MHARTTNSLCFSRRDAVLHALGAPAPVMSFHALTCALHCSRTVEFLHSWHYFMICTSIVQLSVSLPPRYTRSVAMPCQLPVSQHRCSADKTAQTCMVLDPYLPESSGMILGCDVASDNCMGGEEESMKVYEVMCTSRGLA